MKFLILTGLILLVTLPAAAQLAPYWLQDEGCAVEVNGDTPTMSGLHYTAQTTRTPLKLFRDYINTVTDWTSYWYHIDDDGDLFVDSMESFTPSGGYDTEYYYYDPPYKLLDYPLTAGKTWTTTTYPTDLIPGGIERQNVFTGTVIGPQIIDTPLGSLDVIEVAITRSVPSRSYTSTTTYYLHEQLGNITDLVALTGCGTVANEASTWSGIKSAYR